MGISRRSLFRWLSVPLVHLTVAPLWLVKRRYGAVTIKRHTALCRQGVYLHVFHQGRDVTSRCYFADDTGDGLAKVFLEDTNGHRYLEPRSNRAAEETLRGVTFKKGAPFK